MFNSTPRKARSTSAAAPVTRPATTARPPEQPDGLEDSVVSALKAAGCYDPAQIRERARAGLRATESGTTARQNVPRAAAHAIFAELPDALLLDASRRAQLTRHLDRVVGELTNEHERAKAALRQIQLPKAEQPGGLLGTVRAIFGGDGDAGKRLVDVAEAVGRNDRARTAQANAILGQAAMEAAAALLLRTRVFADAEGQVRGRLALERGRVADTIEERVHQARVDAIPNYLREPDQALLLARAVAARLVPADLPRLRRVIESLIDAADADADALDALVAELVSIDRDVIAVAFRDLEHVTAILHETHGEQLTDDGWNAFVEGMGTALENGPTALLGGAYHGGAIRYFEVQPAGNPMLVEFPDNVDAQPATPKHGDARGWLSLVKVQSNLQLSDLAYHAAARDAVATTIARYTPFILPELARGHLSRTASSPVSRVIGEFLERPDGPTTQDDVVETALVDVRTTGNGFASS